MNNIFMCVAGSHMYGTSTPDSDVDMRGVCFNPVDTLLGLNGFEQYMPTGDEALDFSRQFGIAADDVTVYGLNKFVALCLNSNPNIIEMLFAPALFSSHTWDSIISEKRVFLSTKAVHTFSGYAYSQLKRIETHHRWLKNPPQEPDPKDYGYDGTEWFDRTRLPAYKRALDTYNAYMIWRKNRNAARHELELRYGYDTKHAGHLYRLVLEAEELLTTGNITLPLRADIRQVVLDVYSGKYSYNKVVEFAEKGHARLEALPSVLPNQPDRRRANELLISLNLVNIGSQA